MASPHIAGLAAYLLGTEWAAKAAKEEALALQAEAKTSTSFASALGQIAFGSRRSFAGKPEDHLLSPKALKKHMIEIGTPKVLTVSQDTNRLTLLWRVYYLAVGCWTDPFDLVNRTLAMARPTFSHSTTGPRPRRATTTTSRPSLPRRSPKASGVSKRPSRPTTTTRRRRPPPSSRSSRTNSRRSGLRSASRSRRSPTSSGNSHRTLPPPSSSEPITPVFSLFPRACSHTSYEHSEAPSIPAPPAPCAPSDALTVISRFPSLSRVSLVSHCFSVSSLSPSLRICLSPLCPLACTCVAFFRQQTCIQLI